MPDFNNLMRPRPLNRLAEVYAFVQTYVFSLLTTGNGINGDRIRCIQNTRAQRVVQAWLTVNGSLGAACTVQMQRDRAGVYTNMTAASVAGAASVTGNAAIGPIDLAVDDFVVLLIGGANITVAQTVTIDLVCQTS